MKLKKIICIYLALVMVLTGCGQARRLTGGSDTIIESQDENKNGKSDNNSGNAIVPQNPTPAPTPSLLASPPPPTGDKDKNKDAEHSLIDTAKDFARENPEIIALFIFLAGIVWHEFRQNPQPARNRQANQNQQQNQRQARIDQIDQIIQERQEADEIHRKYFKNVDNVRNDHNQEYDNLVQRQRQELNDFDKKLDIGACKEFQAHQLQERQDLEKYYHNRYEDIKVPYRAELNALNQKYADNPLQLELE